MRPHATGQLWGLLSFRFAARLVGRVVGVQRVCCAALARVSSGHPRHACVERAHCFDVGAARGHAADVDWGEGDPDRRQNMMPAALTGERNTKAFARAGITRLAADASDSQRGQELAMMRGPHRVHLRGDFGKLALRSECHRIVLAVAHAQL